MTVPYYVDESVMLLLGDALEQVSTMADGSVDCIVTSPPYFGLRDYGVPGQLGAEPTVAEYVNNLVNLFRECRRVLTDDGTFWLNLGDSYRKDKQLHMVPARVALALQDDGWILRNDIIWHKNNAMPQSVRDRLATKYEHLFLFAKSARYHFDLDPIREAPAYPPERGMMKQDTAWARGGGIDTHRGSRSTHPNGKNPGDVWSINTRAFKSAHFAVFPPDLPRRSVLSGCKPGGTVLDPFSGSATTGMVALELGRKYIGIDINPEYHDLALSTRLAGTTAT